MLCRTLYREHLEHLFLITHQYLPSSVVPRTSESTMKSSAEQPQCPSLPPQGKRRAWNYSHCPCKTREKPQTPEGMAGCCHSLPGWGPCPFWDCQTDPVCTARSLSRDSQRFRAGSQSCSSCSSLPCSGCKPPPFTQPLSRSFKNPFL